MQQPPLLKKGDKVAFVSTARKCSLDEISFAQKLIESWGLEVITGSTIGPTEHQFAGSDSLRTDDLQSMLDDPLIKAVFCAKGGYGTVRLIDSLDFTKFCQYPKWIIGYSDVTVIHSHLQQNFNIQSLHAPLLFQFEKAGAKALEQLKNILFEGRFNLEWSSAKDNKPGLASGKLIGGNLSVLYSLSSSASDIDTKGKILFLEDLDEYLYHVDRMLMQMKRAGKIDNLNGLVVGGMTEMRDNAVPFGEEANEMIERITSAFNFPVAYHCPSGHVDKNFSLPLGADVVLDCRLNHATLTLQ